MHARTHAHAHTHTHTHTKQSRLAVVLWSCLPSQAIPPHHTGTPSQYGEVLHGWGLAGEGAM